MSRLSEYAWAKRFILWELKPTPERKDGARAEDEIKTASETYWHPHHDDGPRYVVASRQLPRAEAQKTGTRWALNGTPPRIPWDEVKRAAFHLGVSLEAGTIFREGGRGEGRWMWRLPPERRDPRALPPDVTQRAQTCRCERPLAYKTRHHGGEVRCLYCARLAPEEVAA